MSSIHLNLGDEIARPDVRNAALALAALEPNATFSLNVSGTVLQLVLGNAPTVVTAVAPVANTPSPVVSTVVTPAAPAADKTTATRFRRTAAETEAGLSVEQAQAFRASGQTDAKAYAASLVGDAEDAVDATLAADDTPAPAAAPEASPAPTPAPAADEPVVVTEADVRSAAILGVKGGKKAEVIEIATKYGVKDWKELNPDQYQAVLNDLTSLMVVK